EELSCRPARGGGDARTAAALAGRARSARGEQGRVEPGLRDHGHAHRTANRIAVAHLERPYSSGVRRLRARHARGRSPRGDRMARRTVAERRLRAVTRVAATRGMTHDYDAHSQYQRAVAETGTVRITECVDAVAIGADETFVVADYGASTGGNSMASVRTAV